MQVEPLEVPITKHASFHADGHPDFCRLLVPQTRWHPLPRHWNTTTIESTERVQKSVTLVDIRSGEVLVSIDVPVGKQLTWDIVPGMGKDGQDPDLMRWQIWDAGTRTGSMQNALSVPNAASVRIDIDVRQDVAYAEAGQLTPRVTVRGSRLVEA